MEKASENKLLVDISVISVTSQLHQTPTSNRPHEPLPHPPARSGRKLQNARQSQKMLDESQTLTQYNNNKHFSAAKIVMF